MRKYMLLLITLAISIAGIAGTVFIQRQLDETIIENDLQVKDFAEEGGAPPEVAISTIFLGGFRNIVINTLWLRMTTLQTQGRYYEMVQLANWILGVQPDNSQVAQFLGWNMAYNISVVHPDKEVRWRWIRHGVRTMQRAIELNPHDIRLYREIGWIYLHKMGEELDDHHLYYKYQLALELYTIYGNKLEPDWNALAAAPADKKEFLKLFPEEAPVWRLAGGNFDDVLKQYIATGTLPEKVNGDELPAFRDGMTRIALKQQFNLDPEVVLEVNRTYGELCWLLPETIAVYWGHQGVKAVDETKELECRRIIAQALKISFSVGSIFFLSEKPEPEFLRFPNTKVFDAATANYMNMFEELSEGNDSLQNTAYATFLQECLITYYLHGDVNGQKKCYELMKKEEFDNAHHMPMERFIKKRMETLINTGNYNQIHSILITLMLRSIHAYANGEHETAAYQLQLASQIHAKYKERYKDISNKDRLKQVSLKEIKDMVVSYIRQKRPELADWLDAALQTAN